MKTKFTLIIGLLIFSYSSDILAQETADLILYNGKIITVDSGDQIFQAIAIIDDKVFALGTDAEITPMAGFGTKMINLNGKTVTPGLIDSHYHMMYYGAQFWPGYLDIRYPAVTSKASLLQVVGDYAQTLNPGDWISGNQGFALQAYEEIDRWELDGVTPYNPAYLRHSSGQYSIVNTLALDIAGIDSLTPNPPGSLIIHDEFGRVTGILSHYPAENLVAQHAKGYGDRTEEQKLEDIEVGQQLCLQAGYTSIQDVIVGNFKDIMLYRQFANEGRLKVRLYAMLYLDTEQEADTAAQLINPQNINTDRYTFGGWKLAMDGGLAARTTLMYDKSLYASQISYPYHNQEEMNRIVQTLHDTGLQVAVHVGGDEGIDMTLTAFENAMQNNPRPDPRHRIEHGLFPTATAIQRFKDGNIVLSTQPQWMVWYGDGYREATNDESMNRLLPLKTLLDLGVHIAFGCDVPASPYQEPKWAFHGSTVRRSSDGIICNINERLSIQEALKIHTMGSAYASFSETTTGSLEVGKFADLVIWSHDLYTMEAADLMNLESEMTVVGGEIVYDKGVNPIVSVESNEIDENFLHSFHLFQNYPNPFNPTTVFSYQLPVISQVSLKIYDVLGREIKTLVNESQSAGMQSIKFDASELPSGIYFYKLTSGDYSAIKKMMLLK
ncbi:MAG: amidohydrolase family protein [bacterium]